MNSFKLIVFLLTAVVFAQEVLGINIEIKKGSIRNQLIDAVDWGDVEKCRRLLNAGADVNTRATTASYNRTILHRAVDVEDEDIVSLLLSRSADVNLRDNTGDTPLHAAAEAGNDKIVSMLIAHNASLEIKGTFGTPLHGAAFKDRLSVIELLLNNSANIEATNKKMWTPLHYAANFGRKDVVLKLLEHGANVFAKGRWTTEQPADLDPYLTPLDLAKKKNLQEIVEILQRKQSELDV